MFDTINQGEKINEASELASAIRLADTCSTFYDGEVIVIDIDGSEKYSTHMGAYYRYVKA